MSISIWTLIIGGLVLFFLGLRYGHSRKEKATLYFVDHFEKRLDGIQEKIIEAQQDAAEDIKRELFEARMELDDVKRRPPPEKEEYSEYPWDGKAAS